MGSALRLLVASLLVLPAGCDEIPGEGVTEDDFRRVCVQQCQQSAGGEGCQTDSILAACADVCASTTFALSGVCLDAYRALVGCEEGQRFVCNGSVQINGVDWPVLADRIECEDADALYRDCPEAAYSL